jgi:hypothetical protein
MSSLSPSSPELCPKAQIDCPANSTGPSSEETFLISKLPVLTMSVVFLFLVIFFSPHCFGVTSMELQCPTSSF